MQDKPRVLLIGEYGLLNGGERSLLAVLDRLHNDWQFEALVPGNTELEAALHRRQIETLPWSTHGDDGSRKTQAEIREELTQTIQTRKHLSLVHCNSVSTSRLVGPVTSKLQIPAVGFLRDILKLSRKAIEDIN